MSRALLATLYHAAVDGAAPGPLTAAALHSALPARGGPVRLFALGKAAHAMAEGAREALARAGHTLAGGVAVAAEGRAAPHAALVEVEGDHPVPGARSFAAAERVGEQIERVRPDDRVVVLLSGGATSLVAAPLPGLPADDLVTLFELLHRSGLDIHTMNVVRKRFTRWGAGRLAVALAPSSVHVLAISDVPGDAVADIASGPCAADDSTAADVLTVLEANGLLASLPATLRSHLDAAARGDVSETPKRGHPAFRHVTARVIASNRHALDAALARARALGLHATLGEHPLAGDAARCGAAIAEALVERAERGEPGCLVWGGETTVHRADTPPAGVGGRCQELALAAARRLATAGAAARRVALLAAGTDGRDGPTDAAGAFADADVWAAIGGAGRDAEHALGRHASYDALDAAGALFRPGPTGTNVMDIVIGLVS